MQKANRIPEIELMKAIAIVGMVFVHIYELTGFAFSINEGPVYLLGLIVEFMGGVISAGTFMFAMGWGIAFSQKATPRTCFDRFTQLILLGLVMNLFTQWIPMLTAAEKTSLAEGWYRIFAVDIYPFAALAMLYFAIIKKLFQREKHRIIASAALLFIALAINMLIPPDGFSTGSNAADTLIGLFIRENGYSYFPFVTWIAFPIIGFGAGSLYRKMNSKKGFAVFLLLSGIAALIVSVPVMKHFNMPNAAIVVDFPEDHSYISVSFIDRGLYYDPLKKPDPDITTGLEEREVGGLGIFMVKQSMDDMTYEYKDGCNILTIRKKIKSINSTKQ